MGLSAENKQRADRGLCAVFLDEEPPPWPSGRTVVAAGLVETVRNLLHLSDRYGIDLLSLTYAATFLYHDDQPNGSDAAAASVHAGRNTRRWLIRRRDVIATAPPSTVGTRTGDERVKAILAEPPADPFEYDEGLL